MLLQWLVLHVLITYSEPRGPGRIIRNMLGWSLSGGNSSVWCMGVPGCPSRENLFSSLAVSGDWVRKGSYHTAWAVPW